MSKSKYDSVAEEYERIRPEFPPELIEVLITHTGVDNSSQLLEIGAGTGKATMPLAQKGYKVDCIEIEPKMADILINKCSLYPNISVTVDNFETWGNVKDSSYDLIYSAQAFHWIDEKIKYGKCYNLLKINGHLALFWYFSVIEFTEVFNKLNSIFSKYNTGFACTGMDDCQKFFDREKESIENSVYFHNIRTFTFESLSMIQTADLFIKRFNTTSAFASLDTQGKSIINEELSEAINTMGGNVTSKLMYSLYIADKA